MVKSPVMKRKWLKLSVLLILLFGSFTACQKKEIERPFAQLETQVLAVDQEGILAEGKVLFFPSGDPVVEHGFIFGRTPGSNVFPDFVFNADTLIIDSPLEGDIFSSRIDKGLLRGAEYYVRAYVSSANWVAYGTSVSFTSQGSGGFHLDGIFPNDTVVPGEILTISGRNIGIDPDALRISIGSETLPLIDITDSRLRFRVPRIVSNNRDIVISNFYNEKAFTFPLPFIPDPVIREWSPAQIADGDTILISGNYFSPVLDWNEVTTFFNQSFTLLSSDRQHISLRLNSSWPPPGGTYNMLVTVGARESNRIQFQFRDIVIEDFFPKSGRIGDTITIIGKNFFNRPEIMFVGMEDHFEGWPVLESSPTQLKVTVGFYPLGAESRISRKLRIGTNAGMVLSGADFTFIR